MILVLDSVSKNASQIYPFDYEDDDDNDENDIIKTNRITYWKKNDCA
jgi:hypothetical protein